METVAHPKKKGHHLPHLHRPHMHMPHLFKKKEELAADEAAFRKAQALAKVFRQTKTAGGWRGHKARAHPLPLFPNMGAVPNGEATAPVPRGEDESLPPWVPLPLAEKAEKAEKDVPTIEVDTLQSDDAPPASPSDSPPDSPPPADAHARVMGQMYGKTKSSKKQKKAKKAKEKEKEKDKIPEVEAEEESSENPEAEQSEAKEAEANEPASNQETDNKADEGAEKSAPAVTIKVPHKVVQVVPRGTGLQAVALYRKAAAMGHPGAIIALGLLYLEQNDWQLSRYDVKNKEEVPPGIEVEAYDPTTLPRAKRMKEWVRPDPQSAIQMLLYGMNKHKEQLQGKSAQETNDGARVHSPKFHHGFSFRSKKHKDKTVGEQAKESSTDSRASASASASGSSSSSNSSSSSSSSSSSDGSDGKQRPLKHSSSRFSFRHGHGHRHWHGHRHGRDREKGHDDPLAGCYHYFDHRDWQRHAPFRLSDYGEILARIAHCFLVGGATGRVLIPRPPTLVSKLGSKVGGGGGGGGGAGGRRRGKPELVCMAPVSAEDAKMEKERKARSLAAYGTASVTASVNAAITAGEKEGGAQQQSDGAPVEAETSGGKAADANISGSKGSKGSKGKPLYLSLPPAKTLGSHSHALRSAATAAFVCSTKGGSESAMRAILQRRQVEEERMRGGVDALARHTHLGLHVTRRFTALHQADGRGLHYLALAATHHQHYHSLLALAVNFFLHGRFRDAAPRLKLCIRIVQGTEQAEAKLPPSPRPQQAAASEAEEGGQERPPAAGAGVVQSSQSAPLLTELYSNHHRRGLHLGHREKRSVPVPVRAVQWLGDSPEDLALPFFFMGQNHEHGLGGEREDKKQAYHMYDAFLRLHPAVDTEGTGTGGIRAGYAHAHGTLLAEAEWMQQQQAGGAVAATTSATSSSSSSSSSNSRPTRYVQPQYPAAVERLTQVELIKQAKHAMVLIDREHNGGLSAAASRAAVTGAAGGVGGTKGGDGIGAVERARTLAAQRHQEVMQLQDPSHKLTAEEKKKVNDEQARERHKLQKAQRGMRKKRIQHSRLKKLGRLTAPV